MSVLKKIGVLSLARIVTVIYAIFGFSMGIVYYTMGKVLPAEELLLSVTPYIYSPWMILIMPVAYALGGFVSSVIIAGLYNIIANKIGGVKLDLK